MKNLKNWLFGAGINFAIAFFIMLNQDSKWVTSQFDEPVTFLLLSGLIGCGVAFVLASLVNVLQKEKFNPADVFRTTGGAALGGLAAALIGFGWYLPIAAVLFVAAAVYIHFKK